MSVEVPVPHPSPAPAAPAAPATAPATGDRAVAPVAGFAPVFTTTPAPGRPGTATAAGSGRCSTGHWPTTAVTSVLLTAFAVLIISGRVVTEGPVVLVLSRTHGIHLGDLYVLAAWVLGTGLPLGSGIRRHRRAEDPRSAHTATSHHAQ